MFLGSSWRGSMPHPSSTFPKDHAVDRRATAQDAAARPMDTAIVCIPLRDRRVIPGKWPLPQGGGNGRDADVRGVVRWAGLQQQYPDTGVLTQPGSEHTARAAGANDNVVIHRYLLTNIHKVDGSLSGRP